MRDAVLARKLRQSYESCWAQLQKEILKHLILNIAETLAVRNPKFDRQRFYEACGLNERRPT